MIKYNKKWCLEHCPYIKEDKKLRFQSYRTLDNLCFYSITDKLNKVCIKVPLNYFMYETNSKKIENFIKENVNMEEHEKDCPIYAEMMIEKWT